MQIHNNDSERTVRVRKAPRSNGFSYYVSLEVPYYNVKTTKVYTCLHTAMAELFYKLVKAMSHKNRWKPEGFVYFRISGTEEDQNQRYVLKLLKKDEINEKFTRIAELQSSGREGSEVR